MSAILGRDAEIRPYRVSYNQIEPPHAGVPSEVGGRLENMPVIYASKRPSREIELSIVMPCLNEERTVGLCVTKATGFLRDHGIRGEVIVADNGSTDQSADVASSSGAVVVHVKEEGYGKALQGGLEASRGRFIIMADSDDSYDLANLMPFLSKLREGYDLVMGNRFTGGIRPAAMPWHHRYVGNPVLSFIGRLFFKSPARDFHCGLRGFTREAIRRMNLQSGGMELASEIVIKASLLDMRVCEIPTTLFPDGRGRPAHLRSLRDGWRHLRFLLIYSPAWLFLYPGVLFVVLGSLLSLALFFGPVNIGFRYIDFHTFIATGSLIYVGLNMLSFAAITRIYAFRTGLLPRAPRFFAAFKYITLETGLLTGSLLVLVGLLVMARAILLSSNFEQIGFNSSVRLVFGGSLAFVSGVQIIWTSFVLSMLGLNNQR